MMLKIILTLSNSVGNFLKSYLAVTRLWQFFDFILSSKVCLWQVVQITRMGSILLANYAVD